MRIASQPITQKPRARRVVSATGQTLLQRFFYRESLTRFDAFEMAVACVFLAAKIEEQPRQVDDVLNVFQRLYQKRRSLPYAPLLVGSLRHSRWKAALMRNEMRVLKELGFSLYDIMEHPHKFVLYYARSQVFSPTHRVVNLLRTEALTLSASNPCTPPITILECKAIVRAPCFTTRDGPFRFRCAAPGSEATTSSRNERGISSTILFGLTSASASRPR